MYTKGRERTLELTRLVFWLCIPQNCEKKHVLLIFFTLLMKNNNCIKINSCFRFRMFFFTGKIRISDFQILIFENFWGPEVVGSSFYQKNMGAEFTHLYWPSLCYKIVVNRHNIGHPNMCGNKLHFLDCTKPT